MTQQQKPSLQLAKTLDPRRLRELFEKVSGRKMTDEEFKEMVSNLEKAEKDTARS